MYELHGARGAGSAIVEGLLESAGAGYRVVDSPPWQAGPHIERLRALNPLVQVPTLVLPDGSVLTESAAITLHLAETFPDAHLAPAPRAAARPAFLRWLVFMAANIYALFGIDDYPERWVSGEEAQAELCRSSDACRKRYWQVVEAAACGGPWFLPSGFSALDLYVAVMTRWRPRRDWFSRSCPKLHAIAVNAEALPRLREVFARNRE